ncbi:MAG: repeat-containing protein [Frankiales bacterium]|nr:repeat-containing protein [Frankiales bacterium]
MQAAYAEGGVFDELAIWASLPSGSQPQVGDVTGDGLADLVVFQAGRIEVRASDANTFGAVQDWGATPAGNLVVDDADGDDTADLLMQSSSGTVSYLPSSGTAFGSALSATVLPASYAFATGDVNGDDRTDAVGRSGTQVSVHLSTAAYPVNDTTWAPDANTPEDPDDTGFSSLAAPSGQAVSGSAGLSIAWSDDDLTSRTLQSEPDTEPDPAVRCSMPQLTAATDPASPQLALDRMRQGGATYIRINVYWSHYLEAPDKLAYRQGLRNAVFCAQRAGLTPYMTITSAKYDSPTPHNVNPNPTQFASLVSAVVPEFYPLGVHRFSLWNEPNLAAYLQAGSCGNAAKETSTLYRSLYSAGYSAARTASNQGAIVYLGELSEIAQTVKPASCLAGAHRTSVSTLDFLKDVVNTSPHLLAHGVAWHAYQHRSSPRTNSKGTGIYDIARFQGVLSDLYHNGQLRTPSGNKPGLYITEFGYWNVPYASHTAKGGRSPVAWSESQRATFLASALNRAAQNGARMFTFWQLNEAYSTLAAVTAGAQTTDGLQFDTGVLGNTRLLEPNGQRPYGVGPVSSPAWNNPQPRSAFCRVRQWATDNNKNPLALASGC